MSNAPEVSKRARAATARAAIDLLNKLFHDEQMDCSNLTATLALLNVQNFDMAYSKDAEGATKRLLDSLGAMTTSLSMQNVISVLEQRQALAVGISESYYALREDLERMLED